MEYVRTPFSSLDELMELTDSPRYPVNTHIEVKAPGKLNAQKVRKALHSALDKHPLSRARKLKPDQQDKQLFWEVTDMAGIDPLLVVEGGAESSVAAIRNQLLSTQVSLHESPPLRVWLVRSRDGDHLMFNVSHAAADGIGTLRFMHSVLRAYNGQSDDVGSVDPLEARNVGELYASSGRQEKIKRLKSLMASMKEQSDAPTAIAADGSEDRAGYGCHHVTLEAGEIKRLNPKLHVKATFNDLLVAALHRSIDVWNQQHDVDSDLIRVMSPVNLRPKDWWYEVFGNFATSFATNSDSKERQKAKRLMTSITRQTRIAKDEGYAEAMLLGFDLNTRLPVWVKNLMFQRTGEAPTTSALLTNAGRLTEEISFGKNRNAKAVWMSPPAAMPNGMGMGVTHYNGRMHLAFRHSYELLGTSAMASFAEVFRESLHWLGTN